MTIFCINIGNIKYAPYALPLIESLCKHNNINLFILDKNIPQNTYNAHPSWLKLFCHTLVQDDYIICWDLDLVPTKLYNIKDMFDTDNINLAYDQCYLREGFTFNGKFRYNCGLFGIPKKAQKWLESIYQKARNSNYPSYEQYHVNDAIYDNNIKVTNLDTKLNMMYDGFPVNENNTNYNIHYTWKIMSEGHRVDLMIDHYNKFHKEVIIS